MATTVERLQVEVNADTSKAKGELKSFSDEGAKIPGWVKAASTAVAGLGLAAGAGLAGGLAAAIDTQTARQKLSGQLNLTKADSERIGKVAGGLYTSAYGDSLGGVNDAIKGVMQNMSGMANASDAELTDVAKAALNIASTFDTDVNSATAAAGQLMRTGLAPDAKSAFDIITAGFQSGADKAGDLLDTFNEYGTQFRKMGLDGATATGLLSQGLKGGARDADLVADSIKEFSIRAIDGSKSTAAGFKSIGLNAKTMSADIAAGGPRAKAALGATLEALKGIKDPAERSAAAVALFGTQSEDMGQALYSLDLSNAAQQLGDVNNRAKELDDTVGGGAAASIEGFKRQVEQTFGNLASVALPPLTDLMNALNTGVGPALKSVGGFMDDHSTTAKVVAGIIGAVLVPALVAWGTQSTIAGAKSVAAWFAAQMGAYKSAAAMAVSMAETVALWVMYGVESTLNAAKVAGAWLLSTGASMATSVAATATAVASAVASWVVMAAQSTLNAIKVAAAWALSTGVGMVTALASMAVAVASVVAGWVLMGVQSMIQAARMAAAWLVAMGPIGWIIVAVVALAALIIANWDTIKNATVAAWNAVVAWVKSAWASIKSAVTGAAAAVWAAVVSAWNSVKAATSAAWNAIKAAVSAAWNGIKSGVSSAVAAVRSAISSAWNTVKSITTSAWNGIKSAVSSAVSGLLGTVRGIPGQVRSALGNLGSLLFNSGKAIIQGLVNGIKNMAGNVTGAVRGVLQAARNLLPFSPAKEGPFSGKGWTLYSGRSISQALADGIGDNQSKVSAAALGLAKSAQPPVDGLTVPGVSIGAGRVAGTLAAPASLASAGAGLGGQVQQVTFNTYYPVAEKQSQTVNRSLARVAGLQIG